MDLNIGEGERRKSRFDELPAISVVNEMGVMMPMISTSSMSSFKSVRDGLTGQTHLYISAQDIAFQKKLDAAMDKNFRYIEKLDNIMTEAAANGVPWHAVREVASNPQTKFVKLFNPTRKQEKIGIGVKKEIKSANISVSDDPRVYVNNLPHDITEEEIEILFGPQGKIRKIKLYTDASGQKKGDALITFCKADSVVASIVKLNGLDIGDGHKIIVQRADYSYSTISNEDTKATEQNNPEDQIFFDTNTFIIQNYLAEKFKRNLPHEFNFVSLPVVIVANGFSYEMKESDVSELEIKLMVEACKYGDIDVIQSLILTLSWSDDLSSIWCQLCAAVNNAGIFVLTFKDNIAAQRFVLEMNSSGPHRDSIFQGRDILAVWIPTTEVLPSDLISASHINPYAHSSSTAKENVVALQISDTQIDKNNVYDVVAEEAADVEDFLNSLL